DRKLSAAGWFCEYSGQIAALFWHGRNSVSVAAFISNAEPLIRRSPRRAPLQLSDYCSPGIPSPPVIFVISDCASALPCSIACFTPLNTTSSRNSTSFGSTISLSILIESTSPAPFAITVTLPPPALTSTVFSSSSAWVLAICSCIFCACFINLFRFIMFGSGFDFAFEHFERFLDERIILELVGLPRRVIVRTLARQSFLRAQLRRPIAAADFFEQSFK